MSTASFAVPLTCYTMTCASPVEGERAGSSQYNQNQEYEPFHLSECRVFLTDRSLRGCNKVVFFRCKYVKRICKMMRTFFLTPTTNEDPMRAPKSFTGKKLTRQKLMLLRSGEDVDRDFEISSFSDESLWVTGQALCARTTVHIEKKKLSSHALQTIASFPPVLQP